MKMTLLNGGFNAALVDSCFDSLIPGMKGLYGKKPVANINTAAGRRKLAVASIHGANTLNLDAMVIKQVPSGPN